MPGRSCAGSGGGKVPGASPEALVGEGCLSPPSPNPAGCPQVVLQKHQPQGCGAAAPGVGQHARLLPHPGKRDLQRYCPTGPTGISCCGHWERHWEAREECCGPAPTRSPVSPGSYSLSVRDFDQNQGEMVKHYKIRNMDNGGYYISPRVTFSSLHELVEYYTRTRRPGAGPACRQGMGWDWDGIGLG